MLPKKGERRPTGPSRSAVDLDAARRTYTCDPPADAVLTLKRRTFMLAGGGAGATLIPTSPMREWRFGAQEQGFELWRGRELVWAVRLNWLSGLSFAASLGDARLRVDGRLPGLDTKLWWQAELVAGTYPPRIRLSHSWWSKPVEVDLAAWLSGAEEARQAAAMQPQFIHAAGVSVTRNEASEMLLRPNLAMAFHGTDAFRCRGKTLNGFASSCLIGPAELRVVRNVEDEPVAHLRLQSAPLQPLSVSPRKQKSGLQLHAFTSEVALLELREAPDRRPHAILVAHTAVPLHIRHAAVAAGLDAHIELTGVSFVADGETQYLVADATSATVGAQDAVLRADTSPGQRTRITLERSGCTIDCKLRWGHVGFVDNNGITLQLRHADPHGVPILDDFLDGVPWHPTRLDLDRVELSAMRAEDGLWLRFRFRGMDLLRGVTGFRLRCRSEAARLWVVLPPQALAEQAFFNAPAWHPAKGFNKNADVYGVPYADIANEKRKSLAESGKDFRDRARGNQTTSDRPPDFRLAAARVSADSSLCFRPADPSAALRLSVDQLLETSRWKLVVADCAFSSSQEWKVKHGGGYPHDLSLSELKEVTHIEMPWRLHISPTETACIEHPPLANARHGKFRSLFYLSPQDSGTDPTPYRAIYSEDSADLLGDHEIAGNPGVIRFSLDKRDRNELVWLTGRWGRTALLGTKNVHPDRTTDQRLGVYDPQPFLVDRIRLTAFGGGMQLQGNWDPPYLEARKGAKNPSFALSIEQWAHRSSLGRTHYERVEYRGWLMPFGFRATLIKLTRRELADWHGYPTAPAVQRYYIHCVEPVLRFPLVGQPVESVNGFCQPERFELVLPNDLQIEDPGPGLIGEGIAAFWVRAGDGEKPWQFDIRIGDGGMARCGLVFVDNTTTHDQDSLSRVRNNFNDSGLSPPQWRTMTMNAVPVCYAPPDKDGGTSFPTDSILTTLLFNEQLVDSTLLEAAKQPPLYPVMENALIGLRALQTQTAGTGTPPAVAVKFNDIYKSAGYDKNANPAEVFLDLLEPRTLGFAGRAERSGGLATPTCKIRTVSRPKGLLSYVPPNPADGASPLDVRAPGLRSSGQELFEPDAMLLGVIGLTELLGDLGIDDLPELIEETEQRFEAIGEELVAQVRKVLPELKEAVQAMQTAWDTGTDVQGWTSSSLYAQIAMPLSTMKSDVGSLERAAQGTDPLEVGKGIATVGKDVKALVEKVETLSRRPELVLGDLLHQTDLQALLNWFEGLRKDWLESGQQAINVLTGQLAQTLAEVTTSLERRFDLLDELQRIDATRTRVALDTIRATRRQLAGIRPGHPEDALQALQSLVAVYPSLYHLRQALLDQISDSVSGTLPWKAFADAISGLLHALTHLTLRSAVLDACKLWQKGLDDAFAAAQSQAAAAAYTMIKPNIERVNMLLKAIHDAEHPRSGSQPKVVSDSAFLRTALELMIVAPVVAGQLAAASEEDVQTIGRAAREAADRAADRVVKGLMLSEPTVISAWSDLQRAAIDFQKALGAAPEAAELDALTHSAVDAGAAVVALAASSAKPSAEQVRSVLALLSEALALRSCLTNPGSVTCAAQWPGVSEVQVHIQQLLTACFAAVKTVLIPFIRGADEAARLANESSLAASIFGTALSKQFPIVRTVVLKLQTFDPRQPRDWLTLTDVLVPEINSNWTGLISLFDQVEYFRDLGSHAVETLRSNLAGLAKRFVPAKVSTSYELKREELEYGGSVFKTGLSEDDRYSRFELSTRMEADLLAGTSSYQMTGTLTRFRILVQGLLTLPVKRISFEGSSTGGFKLNSPELGVPTIEGPLQFVQEVLTLIGVDGGLFVEPTPTSVRAGYRLSQPLLQAGGMTFQNLAFQVSVGLPFDGSPMTVDMALGSAESPVLLSIGIYGGGGYFAMSAHATGITSVTAAFEAGLVGAFNLAGIVKGAGRVTIGIFLQFTNNSADGVVLGGTFYAGGHATVLGIVSIAADLSLALISKGSGAHGSGQFSVRVGFGFFSWTLRYSIVHEQGGAGSSAQATPRLAAAKSSPLDAGGSLAMKHELVEQACWDSYRFAFVEVAA